MSGNATTHGLSKCPEYKSWECMKNRCFNPNNTSYPKYGGRGITVCDRWCVFQFFLFDMGRKPDPSYTIERIDNNGNYEPGNCKWVTRTEQNRNRRIMNGEQRSSKSGVSGVNWLKGRWVAEIDINGTYYYLGRFLNLEDAVIARREAEAKYWK